jgi:hypothetical protein
MKIYFVTMKVMFHGGYVTPAYRQALNLAWYRAGRLEQ